jgi:hypothetical protein
MFPRLIGLAFMALGFFLPVPAQEPTVEYGQASELRGVTKIFVDTGVDAEQRKLIVKELKKRLPNLEVVSRPEESDVHLRFVLKGTQSGRTEGAGTVVKVIGSSRIRVLFSFKDMTPQIFEQDSMMDSAMDFAKPLIFTRQFVKAYRKANA